jgi:hypothetical protein
MTVSPCPVEVEFEVVCPAPIEIEFEPATYVIAAGDGSSSGGPTTAANVSMDLTPFPWTPSDDDDVQAFLEWLWASVPVIAGLSTADNRNIDWLGFGSVTGDSYTEAPANNGFMVADAMSDGSVSGAVCTYRIDAPGGYSSGLPVTGIQCTIVRTDPGDGILRMDFAHNGSYLDEPGTTILDMAPDEILTIRSVGTHWIKVYYSGDAGSGGGGVTSHDELTNRNDADQHSTAAITGLDDALTAKLSTDSNLSDLSDAVQALANLGLGEANEASGWAQLDGAGKILESIVPSSIARGSEVSSAIAALVAGAAASGDTLSELHTRLAAVEALNGYSQSFMLGGM